MEMEQDSISVEKLKSLLYWNYRRLWRNGNLEELQKQI